MLPDLITILAEFGAAGLIGVLWLTERRAAATREQKLDQAHARIIEAQQNRDALLDVVRENTRAIAALEASQRELLTILRDRALVEAAGRSHGSPADGYPVQR